MMNAKQHRDNELPMIGSLKIEGGEEPGGSGGTHCNSALAFERTDANYITSQLNEETMNYRLYTRQRSGGKKYISLISVELGLALNELLKVHELRHEHCPLSAKVVAKLVDPQSQKLDTALPHLTIAIWGR